MAVMEQKLVTISLNDKLILVGASLLALWVSYCLFYRVYELEPDENAVELGRIETTGIIRRRHAKSLAWGDVRGSSKLYLRDIIITPKETGAVVTWGKDQSLTIEPDTMVQFDEVNNERIQVVLFEGKVKQAAPKISTEPMHPVIIKKEEMVRIIPYPKAVRLHEIVKTDSTEQLLEALTQKLSTVQKKELKFEQLVRVEPVHFKLDKVTDFQIRMLSPARTQFNLRKNKWIRFAWHFPMLPDTVFQIEISKEKDFERVLTHKTVKQELELQFEDPAIYYWRVRAIQGKDSVMSFISNFEMFNKSGVEVFSRLPTSQPVGYSWEISKDAKFEKILKNGVANEAKCPSAELEPSVYYCRVREVTTNRTVKMYSLEFK